MEIIRRNKHYELIRENLLSDPRVLDQSDQQRDDTEFYFRLLDEIQYPESDSEEFLNAADICAAKIDETLDQCSQGPQRDEELGVIACRSTLTVAEGYTSKDFLRDLVALQQSRDDY